MIKEIKNSISESIDNIQTFINNKRESIMDKADINTAKNLATKIEQKMKFTSWPKTKISMAEAT